MSQTTNGSNDKYWLNQILSMLSQWTSLKKKSQWTVYMLPQDRGGVNDSNLVGKELMRGSWELLDKQVRKLVTRWDMRDLKFVFSNKITTEMVVDS